MPTCKKWILDLKAPIFIPTRNRPAALENLLEYLQTFYPGTRLIIADGSTQEHKPRVEKIVSTPRKIEIDFHGYPSSISLFDRVNDVLSKVSDEIIITGSDDDFPFMDALQFAARRLQLKPNAVSVIPATLVLRKESDDVVDCKFVPGRSLTGDTGVARTAKHNKWFSFTFYGAVRRSHYLKRSDFLRDKYVTGFGDYLVAMFDISQGDVLGIGDVGYLKMEHETHSILRDIGGTKLANISRFDEMKSFLTTLFVGKNNDRAGDAIDIEKIVHTSLIKYVGYHSRRREVLAYEVNHSLAADVVKQQQQKFLQMFTVGTEERQLREKQIRWAVDCFTKIAKSQDNIGDPKLFSSVSEMSEAH